MADTKDNSTSAASSNSAGIYQNDFAWLSAWIVLALILLLITRTGIGRTLVYYALLLMIFFLIVTQYKWFAGVLKPFSTLSLGSTAAGGASADRKSDQDQSGGQ